MERYKTLEVANPFIGVKPVYKNAKAKSYGVRDIPNYVMVEGQISRICNQVIIEEDSEKSINLMKKYAKRFLNKEFKDAYLYFSRDDGEVYDLVRGFFCMTPGSSEFECNLMDLTRRFAIMRRQITGVPMRNERRGMKRTQEYYYRGNNFPGNNVLKEMAWAVAHSYATGLFMNRKGIFDIIPKTRDLTITTLWNSYLNSQSDISEEVKDELRIGRNGCKFLDRYRNSFCTIKRNDHKQAPATIIEAAEESANEVNAELDSQFKEALIADDIIQKVIPEQEEKVVEEEKQETVETEPVEEQKQIAFDTEDKPSNESGIAAPLTFANLPTRPPFPQNNTNPDEINQYTFGQLLRGNKKDTVNPAEIARYLSFTVKPSM